MMRPLIFILLVLAAIHCKKVLSPEEKAKVLVESFMATRISNYQPLGISYDTNTVPDSKNSSRLYSATILDAISFLENKEFSDEELKANSLFRDTLKRMEEDSVFKKKMYTFYDTVRAYWQITHQYVGSDLIRKKEERTIILYADKEFNKIIGTDDLFIEPYYNWSVEKDSVRTGNR